MGKAENVGEKAIERNRSVTSHPRLYYDELKGGTAGKDECGCGGCCAAAADGALKDERDPPNRLTPCCPEGGSALLPLAMAACAAPTCGTPAMVKLLLAAAGTAGRMVGDLVEASRICGECMCGLSDRAKGDVCMLIGMGGGGGIVLSLKLAGSGPTRTVLAVELDAMDDAEGLDT